LAVAAVVLSGYNTTIPLEVELPLNVPLVLATISVFIADTTLVEGIITALEVIAVTFAKAFEPYM
jgi:hypothetical protein